MNILILGGSVFLGIQLVNSALRNNHTVTLFNRGKRNPDIFPDVEKLIGDRNGSLDALKGRSFDAVIDTSGHIPGEVRNSAELLKDNAGHYTFISSISAYSDFSDMNIKEGSETCKITDGNITEMTMENYGAMKVLCEEAATDVFGDRALNIRPGLIVGENDWSDRFTYWIHRIAQGGKVLAPDDKSSHVQFIDVKDLADWIIKMAEAKKSGLYNATGPGEKLTFGDFIDKCKKFAGNDTEMVWVNEKFIEEEKIIPWSEFPMWVPPSEQGISNVIINKAINGGLKFRSLEDTLKDTIEFDRSRKDHKFRAGLSPERESELIKKWEKLNY